MSLSYLRKGRYGLCSVLQNSLPVLKFTDYTFSALTVNFGQPYLYSNKILKQIYKEWKVIF